MYLMMNLDYRLEVADRRRQVLTAAADRHRLRRQAKAARATNIERAEPTGGRGPTLLAAAAPAPAALKPVAPTQVTAPRELADACTRGS